MRSNPHSKTNLQFQIRIPYQYVFVCHFAEVYYTNALKFPRKKPIFSFKYAFLTNTSSLVTSQKSIPPMLTNPPIKNESLYFPIRLPLSLRRSLFRQCAQIPQLNTNRFHFQYAFLSNTPSFVTSQKSMIPMLSDLQL
jgi:hypothetical protein